MCRASRERRGGEKTLREEKEKAAKSERETLREERRGRKSSLS